MKTFSWILLVLGLGGPLAYADQGYAYAWIPSGSSPTVSTTYSLNPGGGAITVARNGTGSYTVTFPNSGIGVGWIAMAAAYGALNGGYCNAGGWGGNIVQVSCFSASGAAADSAFTILAVSNQNDKQAVFAWANNPTGANYTPSASYSYNPFGGISITRSGTGAYQVVFSGLSGSGGTVQIGTYGGNAVCNSADWTGSLANVNCYDPTGTPTDSLFSIAVIPANAAPIGLAYALAANPQSAGYTPPGATTYNPNSSGVNIVRQGAGQYLVTFASLAVVQAAGGVVRATANDTTARCAVQSWSPGAGGTLQASVGCANVSGNAVDAEFEVLVLPPSGYAYAWIDNGTTADVSLNYSVNPGGAPVTAVHNSTGIYTVTFPKSGIGVGWVAQAQAYGSNATWCKVGSWGADMVSVLCFNSAGTAVDGAFTVLAVSSTNQQNIAFAWADQPTTASHTANASYSYNPSGTISISRASAGSYAVVFNGLNGNGGTVQITAYGTGNTSCYSNGWETPNFEADVVCIDPNGTLVDSNFVVMVIPAGVSPLNIAYAWANQPTAASYNATASFAYNLGGNVAVTRSAVGSYVLTFTGLVLQSLAGGDVRATSYSSSAPRCKVASWGGAPDLKVNVNCFDKTGALADGEYQVLVFAPETGPAAAIVAKAGAGQSAPAGTVFSQSLQAAVTDGFGNALPGVAVTFTAPASGAGGTFTGGSQTATVNADSSGQATAPAFTANNTVGSYQVTAAFLGAAAPATFALTNTALTPVTLQTSPPGLQVSVDGGSFSAAPLTVSLAPGSTHTIATQSPQSSTGAQFTWLNWSDGLAISHTITVPSSAITFTATFKAQYQLTIAASPASGGTVTPASGSFFDAGTVVSISATANPQFTFVNWTGPVASPNIAATTVTMTAPETVTANFQPSTNITIQTSPAGLQFTIDGGPAQTAPQTVGLSQGPHVIAVATTQPGGAGSQFVFTAWSDAGAASHSITVGSAAATFTATFQKQYQLTIAASPANGGSVAPASGAFLNAGSTVPITATANAGFSFSNWSGPVTNPSSASTTVTMTGPLTVTANFTTGTGNSTPTITTVANAEGESGTIAPNTWVEIKGTNLAPPGDTRIWGGSDFIGNTMPTTLDGVHVTVNGIPAFVYFISPAQINILTPPDAMPATVPVVVAINGTASAPFPVQAQALSTSFFVFNGGPYVAAVHNDGALIGPASLFPGSTTPAQAGETVLLYANGFGPTSAPIVSGSETQSGTLSPLPVIKIGGIPAQVQFAGLVFPGEYQFNVTIPASVPSGDQTITATYNGAATQVGTLITVQNAPSATANSGARDPQ